MPQCVYTPEELSFACIMDIVTDVRSGNFSVNLIRKVIKQVDSGLAKFSLPSDSIMFSADQPLDQQLEYICTELKALNDNNREHADNGTLSIVSGVRAVMLLLSLLQLLLQKN